MSLLMTYWEGEVMLILWIKPLHDNFSRKPQAVTCHSILNNISQEIKIKKNYTVRSNLNSSKIYMKVI